MVLVTSTTWIQLFSIVGAILVLSAFAASQYAGMRTDGLTYGLLNLTGSTLLAASALTPPNAGVLLVEGSWALLSLGGGLAMGGGDRNPYHLQFFVGLPLPVVGMTGDEWFPGFYVEPYYRPRLQIISPNPDGSSNDGVSLEAWTHEVGLMLKLTSMRFTWPWEDEAPAAAPAPLP